MATNRIVKRTLKGLLIFLLGLLGVFCLLFVFIQLPAGKRFVKNEVQQYLSKKLQTKVSIASLNYKLPNWIELQGVYLEDRRGDTLLYLGSARVDIKMLALIKGNTDISRVTLSNTRINISRQTNDRSFNFDFITRAFAGNKDKTSDTDTSGLKITLAKLSLNNFHLRFDDAYGGNKFQTDLDTAFVSFERFQPDKLKFNLRELYIDGLNHNMTLLQSLQKETSAAEDGDEASLLISTGKLTIKRSVINITDDVTKMYSGNVLGNVILTNAAFDLKGSYGKADSLILDSSQIVFTSPIINNQTSSSKPDWNFDAKHVTLHHSVFKFDDLLSTPTDGLDAAHLELSAISAEMEDLHNAGASVSGKIKSLSFKEKSGLIIEEAKGNLVFNDTILSLQDFYLKTPNSILQSSFSLQYDSLAGIMANPTKTFVHADLNKSKLAIDELYLLLPSLKESFPPASFAGNNIHFNTKLNGSLAKLYVSHLQVDALSGSKVQGSGILYNLTKPQALSYDMDISSGSLARQDMLKFISPELKEQLGAIPSVINLAGNIKGNTHEIESALHIVGKEIDVTGNISLKIPEGNEPPVYTVHLKKGAFGKGLINSFIPAGSLPEGFSIPPNIVITGLLNGSGDKIVTDANFATGYGDVKIKGFVEKFTDEKTAIYDLDMYLNRFDVGKLMGKDSLMGEITGRVMAKGEGFDYKTMKADISTNLQEWYLNNYTWHNLNVDANLNSGDFRTRLSVSDTAILLKGALQGNLAGDYPVFTGDIRVDTLRLLPLGLHPDEMDMAFSLALDVESLRPHNMKARILADSISFIMHNERYPIDSIAISASSENNIDSITLNSSIVHAYVSGNFGYDKITTALLNYVNHHYTIRGDSTITIPAQQINFEATTTDNHPLFSAILPGLTKISGISVKGNFKNDEDGGMLNFKMSLDTLIYNAVSVGKIDLTLIGDNEKIDYGLKTRSVNVTNKSFNNTSLKGFVKNDSVVVDFLTKDRKGRNWFALNGTLENVDSGYRVHIRDNVMLNYENWKPAADNFILYTKSGWLANNLVLNSDTSRILIRSRENEPNSPIDLSLDNFNLYSISSFINTQEEIIRGTMNARLTVEELDKSVPSFTGYAYVNDLKIMKEPMGELEFYAANIGNDVVSTRIYLTGNRNDVSMSADYNLSTNNVQADMQVDELNAATLRAFSAGHLKRSEGNIHGNISLSGNITNPRWDGKLFFDTTYFALTELGAPYKVVNQEIGLEYPQIQFKQFTIQDSLKNKMFINGNITARSLMKYDLDLGIKTNKFVVLNVEQNPDNEFFGYASIDADIRVRGNSETPEIQGNVLLNDKSDVTIILPEQNFDKDAAKSIVRFVDADTFDIIRSGEKFKDEFDQGSSFVKFLNYNLNIEVNKDATLRILVDPISGDEMTVRGNAQLNAGVDPGGNLLLAGNYELESGSYVLNYQFLQRRFNLLKGSTLTFLGAPMNAQANVSAEYISKAAARELLSNEVSSVDASMANSFNQKIPFKVIMNMTGPLKKPDIKFDIQLPDENSGVKINPDLRTMLENKLSQIRGDETAINKQVFSLLLLNRFISEQSADFFKGSGNGFNDIARQSVSQFLSSALNEIASDLIRGVDIDLNLNSYTDYTGISSNARTDLNLSLSKAFLDDRLVVTVGKNFGIEGQNPANKQDDFNSFIPDLNVAYKLTADGKYMIRAYRRNQYEIILDGYVVETGVGFVMTVDYDKFKEIFRKGKK